MFQIKRKAAIPESSNILIVSKCFPMCSEVAIETQTWKISRSFIEKGHEVTILQISPEIGCENSYMKEGIIITRIPYLFGSYLPSISKQAADYFFNWSIKHLISRNKEKFDIVHVQGESEYLIADNEGFNAIVMQMQG